MREDPLDRAHSPRGPVDLFTDRKTESQAFSDALAEHWLLMYASADAGTARNVLAFYGLGGIGKSELSKRLERWVTNGLPPDDQWGAPPTTSVVATARIDLHTSSGKLEVVQAVVAIRQAFAAVKKRWPAFDVGFMAYWSATHPGEDLPGTGTKYQDVADGISDTICDALEDLDLPGTPVGLGVRGVRAIVSAVRRKTLRKAAFKSSPGYADFLQLLADEPSKEDPKPELLIDLASYLDFELAAMDGPDRLIVVFIDTFERLSSDPRRTGESLLNQLVYVMPNVLFVVTGRNMLDWYDERATRLKYRGPLRWPALQPGATDEPRQHRVGKLHHDDRMTFLEMACNQLELEISDEVVAGIANASGGLPQYLQIACDVAATIVHNGRGPVTVDQVTGSLDELVDRVLDDIPSDEQRALRAAAILPYFDAEIVAAAAQVDVGCALRALSRPMIDERSDELFPYSMHDEIRAALRYAGHGLPGGWSGHDWNAAATRGLRQIRSMYDEHMNSNRVGEAVETLGLAIVLVCDNDASVDASPEPSVYADWLTAAIVLGPSIRALYRLVPIQSTTSYGRGILDFILASSDVPTIDDRCSLMTGVFESEHPLSRPAGRHRSYILRNAYRWDEALASFDELIERAPSDLHRYQRVITMLAARRFRDAMEAATHLTESHQLSVKRSCSLAHGTFGDEWFSAQRLKLNELRQKRRHREAVEQQSMYYRWRALLRCDLTMEDVEQLREQAEITGHRSAIRDALVAHALTDPHGFTRDPDLLRQLEAIDRARNEGRLGFRTAMTAAAMAWWRSDERTLAALRDEIDRTATVRGRLWIPAECLLSHAGFAVRPVDAQWLEPYTDVVERFGGYFETWRSVQAPNDPRSR
ncbi:hypothetical protein [Mycolicibacterium sp. 624]|uniref:hypothetical protein n=1 Tax=Mycolicibacterium sp. 624 TaxID=3156314 RepID=UPI003394FCEB